MGVIPTIPPYAPFIDEVMRHPAVAGGRFNTVMPLVGTIDQELSRLRSLMRGKPLWIDLKGRQIRTSYGHFYKGTEPAPETLVIDGKTYTLDTAHPANKGDILSPPWASIKIDHKIKLDTTKPVPCWFKGGTERATIVRVKDGDVLLMLDGPMRVVGGGESINILHPSLEIEGYLTPLDEIYIKTASSIGMHDYMLSFVERDSDIQDVLALDCEARIVAKIESQKGVEWAKASAFVKSRRVRLMAARGDLWVQTSQIRPDLIIDAEQSIIAADRNAIAASRLLDCLQTGGPKCADVNDVYALSLMGYADFMVGDEVCFNKDALLLAIDMIDAISKKQRPKTTMLQRLFDR